MVNAQGGNLLTIWHLLRFKRNTVVWFTCVNTFVFCESKPTVWSKSEVYFKQYQVSPGKLYREGDILEVPWLKRVLLQGRNHSSVRENDSGHLSDLLRTNAMECIYTDHWVKPSYIFKVTHQLIQLVDLLLMLTFVFTKPLLLLSAHLYHKNTNLLQVLQIKSLEKGLSFFVVLYPKSFFCPSSADPTSSVLYFHWSNSKHTQRTRKSASCSTWCSRPFAFRAFWLDKAGDSFD